MTTAILQTVRDTRLSRRRALVLRSLASKKTSAVATAVPPVPIAVLRRVVVVVTRRARAFARHAGQTWPAFESGVETGDPDAVGAADDDAAADDDGQSPALEMLLPSSLEWQSWWILSLSLVLFLFLSCCVICRCRCSELR